MGPAYDLEEFIQACAGGTGVTVHSKAMAGAQEVFLINTASALLIFIGAGGLENPQFINSKVLEKTFKPEITIMVDAYRFCSGPKEGYIAIFQPQQNTWRIKSFKRWINPAGHNALGNLQQRLEDARAAPKQPNNDHLDQGK